MDSSSQLDRGSVVSVFGVFGDESFLLASFTEAPETVMMTVVSVSEIVYVTYTTAPGPHWDRKGFKLSIMLVEKGIY